MSEFVSILLVLVVPPALVAGWGQLLGRVLAPPRFAPILPWIAPALGVALMGSLGPLAGALGLPLRTIAWPLCLIAAAGLALLARDGVSFRWARAHAPALAVGAGAFLLAVSPLIAQGFLTTVGTSIDAISYNARSEYLQDHALTVPEAPPGEPWLTWVASQIGLIRVGDVYLLGLTSFILSRRSFELLSVISAMAHAYAAIGTYFLARVGLRGSRRAGILASSLVAVNGTLIWPGLDCSFSQALSLSFVPPCLGVGILVFRKPSTRGVLVLGALLSALVTVYPVYAVVVGSAVALIGVSTIVRPSLPGFRWARSRALVAAGFVCLAFSPVASVRALRELGFVGGLLGERGAAAVGAGNILVYPPVSEVLGLASHAAAAHGIDAGRTFESTGGALAVLALGLAAYGLLVNGLGRSVAPLSLLATAGVLALQQRFLVNPPDGYPYGYYKAVTLLALALAPLLAVGLMGRRSLRRPSRWGLLFAGALLLFASLRTLWTIRYAAETQVVASLELVDAAREVNRVSRGRPVELIVEPGPKENWLGYLLRSEKVSFPGGNAIHPVGSQPLPAAAALALLDQDRLSDAESSFAQDRRSRPVWRGSRLRLVEWIDSRLAESPVIGIERWERGTASASVDSAARLLRLQIGGGVGSAALPAPTFRTLQLGIAAPEGAAFSSPEGELRVEPGTWLIDWDASCPGPFSVDLTRGVVVPATIVFLGEATGLEGRCLEVLPSPRGLLTWKAAVEGTILEGEVEVSPPRDSRGAFRVGLHVGGGTATARGWWGVFSLDLPPDGRSHRARFRLDLSRRSGSGRIDGEPAQVEEVAREVREGQFGVTLALWKTRPSVRQLLTTDVGRFEVAPDGRVLAPSATPRLSRWWSDS